MGFTGKHELPWAKWFLKKKPETKPRQEIKVTNQEKRILKRKMKEYSEGNFELSFDEWMKIDK